MSGWRQTALLIRREFLTRARNRAFLITMGCILLAIVAIGPVIAAFQEDPGPIRVGLVGQEPPAIDERLDARASLSGESVEITRFGSQADAEAALSAGDVEVLLADGSTIVFFEDDSLFVAQIVSDSVTAANRLRLMETLGLSAEEMEQLVAPGTVSVTTLVVPDPEEEPRQAAAFIGMLVLYMTILIFGQFVAMGTVEEKQNRVVEIVLSRVRASQLLVGKVVGIGALGLVQLLVLAIAAIIAASIIDVEGIDLQGIGVEIVASVLFWFLLGYTVYAFMYAALGATVSRQEDLQGVLVLPLVFLIPGFFIAQLAVTEGDLSIVRFGSLFPLWSPMVMPIRAALGLATTWEVVLSVVLVILAVIALVWIGARVYSGALLRTGGKVSLRDAWRGARA